MDADFVKFLIYAQASCDETLEWLTYIGECHTDLSVESKKYIKRTRELGRMINKFIQSVDKGHLTKYE